MDESAIKGLAWTSSISRVMVEGFDTSLHAYNLELALRKHFASCGEIRLIYVPRDDIERDRILKGFAFIHIAGEGAKEKALELSGSDVGGWNVFVKPSPYNGIYIDRMADPYSSQERRMLVTGYDTSLPEIDIHIGLRNYFSSCGAVTEVMVPEDRKGCINTKALITILGGEDAVKKSQELSGHDVGGWKIAVVSVMPPRAAPILPKKALELSESDFGGGWSILRKMIQNSEERSDGKYNDPMAGPYPSQEEHKIFVTGYDTSLPKIDIKIGLSNYFSSCGEVTEVMVPGDGNGGINTKALITILGGEDAVKKARELSGHDVGGWKIAVVSVMPPRAAPSLPKKALELSGSDLGGGWSIFSKMIQNNKERTDGKYNDPKKAKMTTE